MITDPAGRQALNAVFGDRISASRIPDILVQFVYSASSNDVTISTSGTATAAVANSTLTISSGAGVGTASVASVDVVRYQPGFDGYAYFTAAFDGTADGGVAEIGPFDTDNGAFIRVTNGVAYFVKRRAGSDDALPITLPFKAGDLDWTKINILRVNYGWLGVAPVALETYNGLVDGWVTLSAFEVLNRSIVPSTEQPSLPITARVSRASGSTPVTLKTCSWSAGRIGTEGVLPSDRTFGEGNSKASVSTEAAIMTIKNAATFQGRTNRVVVELDLITLSTDGTKNATFYLKKGATLGGSPNYVDVDASNSVVSVDKAGTTVTGGKAILPVQMQKVDSKYLDVSGLRIKIRPGEELTISGTSATASDLAAAVRWRELF